jgi:hypothetical protein
MSNVLFRKVRRSFASFLLLCLVLLLSSAEGLFIRLFILGQSILIFDPPKAYLLDCFNVYSWVSMKYHGWIQLQRKHVRKCLLSSPLHRHLQLINRSLWVISSWQISNNSFQPRVSRYNHLGYFLVVDVFLSFAIWICEPSIWSWMKKILNFCWTFLDTFFFLW